MKLLFEETLRKTCYLKKNLLMNGHGKWHRAFVPKTIFFREAKDPFQAKVLNQSQFVRQKFYRIKIGNFGNNYIKTIKKNFRFKGSNEGSH
jgi:hypothetical protein